MPADFYGAFLKSYMANTAAPAAGLRGAEAGPDLDRVMVRLRQASGDPVPLKDLVDTAGNSLAAAVSVLNQLRDMRMIEEQSGGYVLTPAGIEVAGSVRA